MLVTIVPSARSSEREATYLYLVRVSLVVHSPAFSGTYRIFELMEPISGIVSFSVMARLRCSGSAV